jgi:uncharacterized RDD family membrane protein YckC
MIPAMDPQASTIRICPGCGAPVPADASAGLCAQCLLKSDLARLAAASDRAPAGPILVPGQFFGVYRILRLLGQGGMGEVFEAEEAETGRHVALKVLRYAPDSPTARQRFLREGRLAASVNHPNSVYIYGAEEIEGAPVITMEYVPGGTLQDRIKQHGPLPVAEAVDAILQVIAGLEAAGEKGVLHRDVKPSNCFVEADGTVKVGDFGLSISTLARDQTALTMAGSILGTPEYASPEQLRGDELDTRTDIYSVGVTLYYLLTGKTPFHGENMVGLIATVLDKPPPPLRTARPDVPRGVEQVVLRCLAKQAQHRFKTYDQLREALLPFSSIAPTPATLGMRSLAGLIDSIFCAFFVDYAFRFLPFYPRHLDDPLGENPASIGLTVLYFAVLEGFWGATLGKWICRLRVVGPNRNFPGLLRALARALLFTVVPCLPVLLLTRAQLNLWSALGLGIALSLLFFVSARRRNGFAGLHDLLTGTRVIELAAYERRPKLAPANDTPARRDDAPVIGPFHVLDSLADDERGEILLGFDTRLLRRVWIHKQPVGTPSIPPHRRDLARKGRLHWLAGRRSDTECWDAYEALTGQPLVSLLHQPRAWRSVRYWLQDLAEEFQAARSDGTLPGPLELNRVWITEDGRARLLDFPAPGAGIAATGKGPPYLPLTGQQFLGQVAHATLSGQGLPAEIHAEPPQVPLPVSVRQFLKSLPTTSDMDATLAQLRPLLDKPAAVSRGRRLALLSCAALLAVLEAVFVLEQELEDLRNEGRAPGVVELHHCLSLHGDYFEAGSVIFWNPTNAAYKAMQVYVVSNFRSQVTNESFWSNKVVQIVIPADERQFAKRALADYPAPTDAEIENARALLKPYLPKPLSRMAWLEVSGGLVLMAVFSLLAVLLFRRGPMFRVLGVEVVTRNGLPAGRWLIFVRAMVTWLPLLVLFIPIPYSHNLRPVLLVPFLGGAIYAVLHPERGLQDRLAGTWLVPI